MKTYYIWLLTIVISILGYGLTYVFEYGYFSYFNIPTELITIELNSVIYAIFRLIILFSIIIVFYYFIVMPLAKIPFWNILVPVFYGITVIMLPNYLIYRSSLKQWLLGLGINLIACATIFLLYFIPMILKKRRTNIPIKIQMKEIQDKEIPNTILKLPQVILLFKPINFRYIVFIIILALIWICNLSYSYGKTQASFEETYLISSQPEEAVVLRVYDNKMICAPLDRTTNSIKPGIFIINNDESIVLRQEHIGRLKVNHDIHWTYN